MGDFEIRTTNTDIHSIMPGTVIYALFGMSTDQLINELKCSPENYGVTIQSGNRKGEGIRCQVKD